jgi:phage terminase large subunit GpA-like protein
LTASVFAEAVAPDAELTVSQWADAKRVLSEMSAEPGPWRTARVPYTREIMDALSVGDACQEVVLMKGTQVAGTETATTGSATSSTWRRARDDGDADFEHR